MRSAAATPKSEALKAVPARWALALGSGARGTTPFCLSGCALLEGALAAVRVRCTLWVTSGAPPGGHCNPSRGLQDRTNTTRMPLGIIGNHNKNRRKTGGVLATQVLRGCMSCLGGYPPPPPETVTSMFF